MDPASAASTWCTTHATAYPHANAAQGAHVSQTRRLDELVLEAGIRYGLRLCALIGAHRQTAAELQAELASDSPSEVEQGAACRNRHSVTT